MQMRTFVRLLFWIIQELTDNIFKIFFSKGYIFIHAQTEVTHLIEGYRNTKPTTGLRLTR